MAYLVVVVIELGLWLSAEELATSACSWLRCGWVLPFLMNTAGWLLTESGRQPWIVQGIMLTKNGISPTVSTTWLWISLVVFIVLYGILGTVDLTADAAGTPAGNSRPHARTPRRTRRHPRFR